MKWNANWAATEMSFHVINLQWNEIVIVAKSACLVEWDKET